MENNFEAVKKEIDLSTIDVDSNSFDRKYLELEDSFETNFQFQESFYNREFDLANNLDDEIQRRTRLSQINSDFENRMARLNKEYEDHLKELVEKYEKKTEYPFYFRWLFQGDSSSYNNLLNGLTYYIKQISEDTIRVYNDAKFNRYLGEFKYVESDWRDIFVKPEIVQAKMMK